LVGLDDLAELLTTRLLRYPDFRLVRHGSVIPIAGYARLEQDEFGGTSLIPDLDRLYQALDGGATLILQNVQRYWAPLQELARELESLTGVPCPCSLFFSPAEARGLDRHSDPYEGLVFQSVGEKEWEVLDRDGAPVVATTLRPGDTLYVPQGYPHRAQSRSGPSLHVTFSLSGTTWRRLFSDLLESSGPDDLDRFVPIDPSTRVEACADRVRQLADWAVALDAGTVIDFHDAQHPVSALPAGPARLASALDSAAIDDETVVRWVPGRSELKVDASTAALFLADRVIEIPVRAAEAVRRLRDGSACRARELEPPLDRQGALVLVRRLLREGVLRALDPPTGKLTGSTPPSPGVQR
jgi:hypothetical protein